MLWILQSSVTPYVTVCSVTSVLCKLLRIIYFQSNMESDFSGKKYLVTGVGSGIGRALALELANSGAEVWGVSRTKSNLDSLTVTKYCQY